MVEPGSAMRFFRENTGLKILAIVVSVVLWSFVKISQGPGSVRMQLTLAVPLEVEGLGPEIEVDNKPSNVRVTIRGEARDLDQMPENFVRARVDVTGLSPGLYPRQVRVIPPGGVELIATEPAQVTLSLSRKDSRTVPVEIILNGKPASGMVVGNVAVDPATVKVTGPESAVKDVHRVRGEIVLAAEQQSFTMNVRDLLPVDENSRLVPRVSVTGAHKVLASVELQSISASVGVPVSVANVTVTPRPGVRHSIHVIPQFVSVRTGPGVRKPNSVPTAAIDFGEVSEVTRRSVALAMPEGVVLVSDEDDVVEVEVIPVRVPMPTPSPTQSQTASPQRPRPSPRS
ncbi:hypothetical protein DYH09_27395 [bacterium CPR1]|nr:hypothetical protein [bacterium CPR1]